MECIFIVTCERSGSTLLRCLLDAHAEIYSPGEISIGPLCESLYNTIFYTKGQLNNIRSEAEREAVVMDEIRDVLSERMGRYTQANHKAVWCDKSPVNVHHLGLIRKVFPAAKFICLYRNCLDVVHSCIALSRMGFMPELCEYVKKHPQNLPAAMVDSWLDKTGKILDFARSNPSGCFSITYESLVSRPEETLSKLFGFLGMEADMNVFDAVFSGSYEFGQMNGDIKMLFSSNIYTDSIGKGAAVPSTYITEQHFKKINEVQAAIGYPQMLDVRSFYRELTAHGAVEITEGEMGEKVKNVLDSVLPSQLSGNGRDFSSISGSCNLIVTGNGGGEWFIDFAKNPGTIRSGKNLADCDIAVSSATLLELVEGRTNVAEAYEAGHIGADGNLNMAIKIGRALFKA